MKTYEYLQERIEEDSDVVSTMDKLGYDGWKLVTITEYHPEKKNVEGNVVESRSALYTFIKRRPKNRRP